MKTFWTEYLIRFFKGILVKKRDRKIGYVEYRKLLGELRQLAVMHGFTISVSRKRLSWYYEWNNPNTCGEFLMQEQVLRIRVKGRPARRDVLYVIAHEVRHMLHWVEGLYPNYYYTVDPDVFKIKDPNAIVVPNLGVAQRAEQDCNDWADKWLISKNLKPFNAKYPRTETLAYRILEYKKELIARRKAV